MLRCAIVPPVPVPYREPLFERLAGRPDLLVRVIYQAAVQPSWDQSRGWFPANHGYDAVDLAPRQIARSGRSPITWPRGLERELSRFGPDVVVVSEFGPASLRALAWCRARRRAIVLLTEVTAEVQASLPAAQRMLHRLLVRHVDGLIAVSSAARERLLVLGAAPEAVALSMQPVDEDALLAAACRRRSGAPAAADEPRLEESAPVQVLTVARLVPDKDVGLLIEAFAAAGLREQEAFLSIVGGGPLEEQLRARARALGVPARFLGALPATELPGRYAAADIFALSSRFEPFGVALREAVVAGLPVVCSTAVGAAADLAHEGANAMLLAPGDLDALAHALSRLCREPALRQQMGAESRRIAVRHPLQTDVESFAAAIRQAAPAARAAR
jgi:phosphatidylinositol alpha-1,6-mannosyltransferase